MRKDLAALFFFFDFFFLESSGKLEFCELNETRLGSRQGQGTALLARISLVAVPVTGSTLEMHLQTDLSDLPPAQCTPTQLPPLIPRVRVGSGWVGREWEEGFCAVFEAGCSLQ